MMFDVTKEKKRRSWVQGEETSEYEDNPDADSFPEVEIVPENKKISVTFLESLGMGYTRFSNQHNSEQSFVDGYGHSSSSPPVGGTNTNTNTNSNTNDSKGGAFLNGSNANANTNGGNTSIRTLQYNRSYQLDDTEHYIKGKGILASKRDMRVAPDEFAEGCKLLQASALGDTQAVKRQLTNRPDHINFRDYDRRTALHVASSEGHLDLVRVLVEHYNAPIHRSDRWGGSPLDDAHRHRHTEVVQYLRSRGASTGSTDQTSNLITASAMGDLEEVKMLLGYDEDVDVKAPPDKEQPVNKSVSLMNFARIQQSIIGNSSSRSRTNSSASRILEKRSKIDVNGGDYDGRTALHLCSAAGHVAVLRFLISKGANVNVVDSFGGRPLDDAIRMKRVQCVKVLKDVGGKVGERKYLDESRNRTKSKEEKNLKIEFSELEMIDKIGSGAFGEIYKCRWRGTLVAAKCIRNTKIVELWREENMNATQRSWGRNEMDPSEVKEALNDFRVETAILRTLRHPNICMLLGYSQTENFEVMISELMRCSLLDVFKSHIINMTRMSKKKQVVYAQQLARGMNYLHQCNPPIIHRDLKPANLLIDVSGTLKISDFGLAKVRPEPKAEETDEFRMTGETGSYRFMAPEVFRHENYSETVDVYSFAMIFYHLLAGRPPWEQLDGLKAVIKAATEAERPIVDRSWDMELTGLMQRCWAEIPSARPSFSVILKELQEYSTTALNLDADNISVPDDDQRRCSRCVIS